MKVMLLMLFLVGSSALAQDRMSDEKYWAVLQSLMDDMTDDAVIDHLAHHGFRVDNIEPLRQYIASGRRALYEQAKADWKRQCSQRTVLTKDGLVAELEAADRRYAAILRGIIANVPLVVNDDELQTLNDLVAERKTTVVLADAAGKVRDGEVSAEKLLERTCQIAEEGGAS